MKITFELASENELYALKDMLIQLTESAKTDFRTDILAFSVKTLDLLVRTTNCLLSDNIRTIGLLVSKTEEELLRVPNLSRRAVNEIKDKLAFVQLSLREDHENQTRTL